MKLQKEQRNSLKECLETILEKKKSGKKLSISVILLIYKIIIDCVCVCCVIV